MAIISILADALIKNKKTPFGWAGAGRGFLWQY
jgi:hypothetical protein